MDYHSPEILTDNATIQWLIESRYPVVRHRIIRTISLLGHPRYRNDTVRIGDRPTYHACLSDRRYLRLCRLPGTETEQLAYMVHAYDGRRANRRYDEQLTPWDSELVAPPPPVRQPQHVASRRSALCSVDDLPAIIRFEQTDEQLHAIVEEVRLRMVTAGIETMRGRGELMYYEGHGLWTIYPSVLEAWNKERLGPYGKPHRLKMDQRPFHGRPNRDRRGLVVGSI